METTTTYKKHAIWTHADGRITYHYAGRWMGDASTVEAAKQCIDWRVEDLEAKKAKKAARKYKTWGEMERRIAELEATLAATKYQTGWRGNYGQQVIALPLDPSVQDELRSTINDRCCELAGEGDLVRENDGVRTYKLVVDLDLGTEYAVVYTLDDVIGVEVQSIGLARRVNVK